MARVFRGIVQKLLLQLETLLDVVVTSPNNGDLLTYQSSTHTWVNAPAGSSSSPLTTKGDLYGYSTTNARIPIGTDTYVLTADSSQALGLKWAASSGSGTVTTTGSPASGNLTKFSGSTSITNGDLSGDITTSGTLVTTLATVNTNTGSFGSSTSIPNFTVNGKGLITAAGGNVVIAPAGTLTGTTLASNVVTSSLTTVGTIGTGTWQGTAVAPTYGGTGQDTHTSTGVAQVSSGTWSVSTALANGITATTQSAADNSTKAATTAYADRAATNASGVITEIDFSAGSTTAVGNQTFYLISKAAFAGTINTLLGAGTVSGTITAAVKINGTNVTGLSAVSLTSTPGDTSASGANTFSVGDAITLVTSSSSSDLGLQFTLKITRT